MNKQDDCQACIGFEAKHTCKGYDAFVDMKQHRENDYQRLVGRVVKLRQALRQIDQDSPADVHIGEWFHSRRMIARKALQND